MSKVFLSLDNITVRLGSTSILENSSWDIKQDEQWAIIGPNGSGKSSLVKALWGGTSISRGRTIYHFAPEEHRFNPAANKDLIGYVAFELHQNIMQQEELLDDFRYFAGELEAGTTAKDVMLSAVQDYSEEKLQEIVKKLGITEQLSRKVGELSTGEMRKTLIARALMKDPKLLILDEPFDGLDEASRKSLASSINNLINDKNAIRIILIAHRLEEIVPKINKVMLIKDGKIFDQGSKEKILTGKKMSQLFDADLLVKQEGEKYSLSFNIHRENLDLKGLYSNSKASNEKVPLIEMKEVTVKYGAFKALDRLSWKMSSGENWCILGHNGSGKSTIVKLITGDNLQGYSNNINIFGQRKGSHESVWAIKKQLGVVSSEMQIQYRKNMSSFDVVCSGFYDSIGLYKEPTDKEKEVAQRWVDLLGIKDLKDHNFHQLSYGQKRMMLLARAMVKTPKLLIVDEPCHGLDVKNRSRILQIIEKIGNTPTNILYITHHKEEILPCITNILELHQGKVVTIHNK